MKPGVAGSVPDAPGNTPQPGPGRLGLGGALRRAWVGYQLRLDEQLAAAGFEDRRFPDGRVLRICLRSSDATTSQIGRELGITRQGASKIVASLRDRRFVTLEASPSDGREKVVKLTPRATAYLAAHRTAARTIERQLRTELGADGLDALDRLLAALGGDEPPRMIDYLRRAANVDALRHSED